MKKGVLGKFQNLNQWFHKWEHSWGLEKCYHDTNHLYIWDIPIPWSGFKRNWVSPACSCWNLHKTAVLAVWRLLKELISSLLKEGNWDQEKQNSFSQSSNQVLLSWNYLSDFQDSTFTHSRLLSISEPTIASLRKAFLFLATRGGQAGTVPHKGICQCQSPAMQCQIQHLFLVLSTYVLVIKELIYLNKP